MCCKTPEDQKSEPKSRMEKENGKFESRKRHIESIPSDESAKEQKITLEEEGRTLTGKAAANTFASAYKEASDTSIPRNLEQEVRKEEREREMGQGLVYDATKEELKLTELRRAIDKLKKTKSPGPDNITNEMLQHLGSTALQKLLDIYIILVGKKVRLHRYGRKPS